MDRSREDQLLELAVAKGLISDEDVRAAGEAPPPDASPGPLEDVWGARLAALIRAGRLDRKRLLALMDDLGSSDETLVDVPWRRQASDGEEADEVAGGVDWMVETAAEAPRSPGADLDFLEGWERFRVVAFLGSGGMGRVYKAFDPSLGRFTALKFLRWNDPLQLERFLREARAQARVDHDNVCKVYEAGKVRGHPYIAMQFIDGETLGAVADLLTLEQKVQVIRDVAHAVHAAHRTGLIHRDLKPGNILLERQEDGSWRPFVVDFGLAHDAEAMGLTRTGAVTGTPAYLAPEQAQGRLIDRRSDVYSLGVVLYELLAGDVPLRGGSLAESLVKVITENPSPLRRLAPSLPRDLETVTMKCLEKEPQRRYDSARVLAEDLDRFLDGQPIQARRASLAYRSAMWVRRNRPLAGVLAGAAALLLALGAWSLHAQWRAEQRARLLQRFSQEVAQVEAEMRHVSMLPRHDVTPHKERLRRRMAHVAREMERLGSVAAGPGHYALGRGSLALHDYSAALAHLEEAWERGETEPEVASGLGRALGVLYQKALVVVADGAGGRAPAAADGQDEVERRYLAPALGYLREGGEADNPYVEAMIAFYDRRYDEALARAQAAYAETPWFYEAKQLEAEVFLERGERARYGGRFEEALSFYAQAGEAYAHLIDVARSDPTVYAAECRRRLQVLLVTADHSSFADEEAEAAIAPCDLALTIDGELAEAYGYKAHAYWRWGQQADRRGEDPRPYYEEALVLARRTLAIDDREVLAYRHLATANRGLAEWALAHGEDPDPYLDAAIASLERGLEIQPRVVMNLNQLGSVYYIQAQVEMGRGEDPGPSLDAAIANFRQAVDLNPWGGNLSNLGVVLVERALYEGRRGIDPTPAIEEAIGVFHRALELNPNHPQAHNNLGFAYASLGEVQGGRGEDPRSALEKGLACYRRAASLRPGDADYVFSIGWVHRLAAAYDLDRGADPGEELAAAREALIEAEQLSADAETYGERARIELLALRWARRRGEPSAPYAEAAARALEAGFRENSKDAALHVQEAALHRALAEWARGRGADASGDLERGLVAARRALELNPNAAEALALEGTLLLLAAQDAGASAAERSDAASSAATAFARALERDPLLRREYGPLEGEARSLAGAGS